MNIENHMVVDGPDAPWNVPGETESQERERNAAEQKERDRIAARDLKVAEFVGGLNELAAFVEDHPETPLPFGIFLQSFYEKEPFVKAVAVLAHGGRVNKSAGSPDNTYGEYKAERMFGPITMRYSIARSKVCRLVSPAVYECPDSLLEAAAEYKETA